jgi:predicted deacylase
MNMNIGTCRSEKGRLSKGELVVAVDAQSGQITIPILVAGGPSNGKTIFLSAGVHGDEINGIEILQRFINNLDVTALKGTIIFLPLINVSGFKAKDRYVQYDGKDLNRCFPGDDKGTVSEQIAHTIFKEVVSRCEFGVDIHDSGKGSVLLPHSRAHIRDDTGGYDNSYLDVVSAFGTDIIMLCKGMDGVLTIEAYKHFGITAFTVEIGGAMILWEEFIQRALMGLNNTLIYQGMLEGKMILPKEQFLIPGEDDISVKAKMGGILNPKTKLGKAVDKGEELAEIYNPITLEREIIVAQKCGVVHDLNVSAKVNEGEDVIGVLEFAT